MAEAFAHQYEQVLNSSFARRHALLEFAPRRQERPNADQLVNSLEKSKPKDKMMMEQKYGGLLSLYKRLKASKEEHAEFVSIEALGVDDHQGTEMPVYALAVYEIHGPGSKEFPEKGAIRSGDSQRPAKRQTVRVVGRWTSGSHIRPRAMWHRLLRLTTVTATHTDSYSGPSSSNLVRDSAPPDNAGAAASARTGIR